MSAACRYMVQMGKKPSYTELLTENRQLRLENAELRAEVERLQRIIDDLTKQIDELKRASLRQAAPFRVPEAKRVKDRKRPGRKPGHPGSHRRAPDHIDEHVEVPLAACPHCGGAVADVHAVTQYIEDLPPVRPHVTELVTYRGRCRRCGPVASGHPLQMSTATGAAGTQLGPRAVAMAAELHHRLGMTFRKIAELFRSAFGLRVTAGGLSQALARAGRKLCGAYHAVKARIRGSPAVYADETSWWVGGPGWWLWVFTTPTDTAYLVEACRGQTVVHDQLGERFGGVLVSDCLASYDPIDCLKHKCYAHHHRAIADAQAQRPDSSFLKNLRAMLTAAQVLGAGERDSPGYADLRHRLDLWADTLLTEPRADPAEEAPANRLRKRRQHLFTFLDHPGVDATNNRAERQLRPAVIARKVSCGNKTEAGKRTWEVLTSLAATCQQRARSFIEFVADAMPLHAPAPALGR